MVQKRPAAGIHYSVRVKRWAIGLLIVAVVVCCALYFGRNFSLQIKDNGRAMVQETLQRQINETCRTILQNVSSPIIETLQDNDVRHISVDAVYMNNLAAQCNTQCAKDLACYERLAVSIPRGTLFGSTYLADKGRAVTYTVSTSYELSTDYRTVCQSVGINQIRYAVYLLVQANAHITVPASIQNVQYTYCIPVCETLYSAEVPNVYVADDNGTDYLDLLPD